MNSFLLNRQLGSVSQYDLARAEQQHLLQSIQAAPGVTFNIDSREEPDNCSGEEEIQHETITQHALAHAAGVNSICIDRFEGKYLLSGGADSSIAIWDLDIGASSAGVYAKHFPLTQVARSSTTQSLGITHIDFYAFDSLAFLTGGYDQTLKLFSSETLTASATFDLGSTVYSHSMSKISTHLLVASATEHPAVRLIDLRSGSSTHALAGHSGAVLTVAWHPTDENLLASGASDGCIRLWDIRRSASSLGVLDMDDSIGIAGYDGKGTHGRRRERGTAHKGTVNGLSWSDNGTHLVSVGHDEKMRVWDMIVGANTLANFGPVLRNAHRTLLLPMMPPSRVDVPGTSTIFIPNGSEILGFDLHSGTLRHRLRATAVGAGLQARGTSSAVQKLKNRCTSLAWRAHDIEMYSAHSDGTVRCWRPVTWEDGVADEEMKLDGDDDEEAASDRKRKRDELDQIVRDLTKKPITFT